MLIQTSIEKKLNEFLKPLYIKVTNESHMHNVPKGSETHFRIELVSAEFEQKKLLDRHRMVNTLLTNDLANIRACSLHLFTSLEWEKRNGETLRSPRCVGGSQI